ncbi:MAG: hypothetical protein ABJN24_11620 [Hyphomicrobiales bacterium]
MNKPIRIYLDTSDYSRLLSASTGNQDEQIKTQLLDWVDSGAIEIGYSFWIITEFIKSGATQYAEKSREKGRLIKELTKGKSFPHPVDLKSGAKFPNDGIWMRSDLFKKATAKKFLNDMANKAKRDYRFNKSQHLKLGTKSGIKQFLLEVGFGDSIKKEDFFPFPVSSEFIKKKYFQKLLLGQITDTQFQIEYMRSSNDPEEYFDLFFQNLKLDDPIDAMIDKFFLEISTNVQPLVESIKNTEKLEKEAIKSYQNYKQQLAESKLPEAIKSVLPELKKPIKSEQPKVNLFGTLPEKFFPMGQTEYFNEYSNCILKGQKIKRSDIADLMHLQYIFNCDLFRCDKKMAKLFAQSKSLPSEKIVPSLIELPSRIQELLLKRH